MTKTRIGILTALFTGCALQAAAPAVLAQASPEQKQATTAGVDKRAKLVQEMVDSVFSFAEPGFQEFRTSEYLTGILEKNGFTFSVAWPAFRPRGPRPGAGRAVDCAGQRHRRIARPVADAGLADDQAAGDGCARPWRRSQLRHAGDRRRGAVGSRK